MPNRRGKKRKASYWTNNQRAIEHLLTEKNELQKIFGSASPTDALRVALRLKRAKKRSADLSPEALKTPARCRDFKDRPGRERNYHHLTPQLREGQPFFGDSIHNKLLIRTARHEALHREFGRRTWEEIIFLLALSAEVERQFREDLTVGPSRRTPCRHICRRRAHRVLQSFTYHPDLGILPGSFLSWSGRRELNPVNVHPKHVYYRYTTARTVTLHLKPLSEFYQSYRKSIYPSISPCMCPYSCRLYFPRDGLLF